jgi:hypothetical protein
MTFDPPEPFNVCDEGIFRETKAGALGRAVDHLMQRTG